jgi:CHAT domain-containing protein/tRNA A-37 threonylcarbamoyl transferase component Bud32/Tfp pilus assembly protein PilF
MSANFQPMPREERLHEAVLAYFRAADAGRVPSPQEFLAAHPDLADDLQAFLTGEEHLRALLSPLRALSPAVPLTESAAEQAETVTASLHSPPADPPLHLDTTSSQHPPPVSDGAPTIPGYEILGVLGAGGMGVVYKARQVHMNRTVALKMIHTRQLASDAAHARFRVEAQAVAKFDHPNIVRVYDSGESGEQPYMVLEYVNGGSLRDTLKNGPWVPRRAAELVAALADAVQYAHGQGVIHRDLKPANVLLTPVGTPKVGDFGLAKLLEGGADAVPSTAVLGSPADSRGRQLIERCVDDASPSIAILGTPGYMPPEQAEGGKPVGPAADVYGLGGILYHLLTGRPPRQGESVTAVLQQARRGEVVSPQKVNARVPAALDRICMKALTADPAQRYASAAALAGDLRDYLARPRRLALAVGAVAALLLLGVAAWLIVAATPGTFPDVARRPSTEVPAAALKGLINVRVWEGKKVTGPRNPNRRGLSLHQLDALPLKVGDEIQLEAELTRPMFVYVVWINSVGKALPVYPWRNFRWDQRPADEQAVARLKLPEGASDGGWELDEGAPGMETLLLLARDSQLSPEGETVLKATLAEFSPQPLQDAQTNAAVWFENGAVVNVKGQAPKSFDVRRIDDPVLEQAAKSFDVRRIDDPVLRTQDMLRDKLGPHFSYTWAVSFAVLSKGHYSDGHPQLAISLNNRGTLLKDQGEYARAEPFLRDALAMYGKLYPKESFPDGHPELARSLTNFGLILQHQGEYARAEPFLRDALAMYGKLYPPGRYPNGHPELAGSLSNMGDLLVAQREYAKADPFFRDALAMYQNLYPKESFPDGHPALAGSLNALGLLMQAQAEYAKAETFYRNALEMNQKLYPRKRYADGHPELARSLNNLGFLLKAQGEYARAEPFFRDALEMYAAQLRSFADLKSEAEAFNRLADLPPTRDGFLTLSRHLPPRAQHYQLLYQGKSALSRIFERRHLDVAASQDDEARTLSRELSSARGRLARLTVVPLPDPQAHAARLQELTEQKEEVEQKLARRLKVIAPPRTQDAVTPDDLLRALPKDTAFVDLLRYWSIDQDPKVPGEPGESRTPRYLAFVLRQGQPVQRVELGEAEPIEQALKQWRREIIDWRPDRNTTPSGADAKLSELVWKPLAKHIPADTATVYLSPDADLTALPWAALPGRDKGKVLLEEHALALVPHGPWLLERLQAKPAKEDRPGTLLAVVAVAYDRAPKDGTKPLPEDLGAAEKVRGGKRAEWVDLKGTERELKQVIASVGQREVIVRRGTDAGLTQVSSDLEKARYAHLATHGFFDDQGTRSVLQLTEEDYRRGWRGERIGVGKRNPMLLSGLVLAGANRKEKDRPETWAADGGILLGEDIVGCNLHRMELAVLSACETGLGDVTFGEGVFSLQRAFHVAGCRNVVASLWQVDDDATAALMNLFYARLWHPDPTKRLPPLLALREAQLTLYRQPELIPQFAPGDVRGPKNYEINRIEDKEVAHPALGASTVGLLGSPHGHGLLLAASALFPGRTKEVKAGEKKAHAKQWAAFVLSGDGR